MRVWTLVALMALAGGAAGPTEEEPAAAPGELRNGSFTASLNGFDIHYEVHGSGPVVMTVPNSWGLSLEGLRALLGGMERYATMVYFDPRGMGESAAVRQPADMGPQAVREDFDALRRHLGLERVNAIGWSNGAFNLVLLAAEHPEAIESAIFLHGGASFGPEDGQRMMQRYPEVFRQFGAFQQEMAADTESTPEQRTARLRELYLDQWFPAMFADPARASVVLPELYADAEFSYEHAMYTQQAWPTIDLRDRLPDVAARSLVIAGAHDMLPPERVKQLHDALASSTWVVFDGSGHFSPVEEPEKFHATVSAFLAE